MYCKKGLLVLPAPLVVARFALTMVTAVVAVVLLVEPSLAQSQSGAHLAGHAGAAGIPGDARLVVSFIAPIIVFIVAGIVGFGFKRYHLTRSLNTDIDYRLRFEILAVYGLRDQLAELRRWSAAFAEKRSAPPFLRMVKEDHLMYPSMQSDLVSCLWGNEIDAVRNFYRDFQHIERRAGQIEAIYQEIVRRYGDISCQPPPGNEATKYGVEQQQALEGYVDQIKNISEIMRSLVQFWLRRLWDPGFSFAKNCDPKLMSNLAFPNAARSLLYGPFIWYPTFVVIPILGIFVLFAAAFSLVFYPSAVADFVTEEGWRSATIFVMLVGVFIGLPLWLADIGSRKIQSQVLFDFGTRLRDRLGR